MVSSAADTPYQSFIGPLRLTLKAMRLGILVVVSIVVIPLVPVLGKRRAPAVVRWWHGRLLHVLGLDIRVHGRMPQTPALIVTNHSTWLDIVVLGHVFDAAFISKTEVGKWPIIGIYARATGTLFLARGGHRTDSIRQQVHTTFANGRSVVLFPEGTTCATLPPRRFHARLFSAALDGGHPVLPMALRYSDSETPKTAHHPLIPWVGTSLSSNFSRVFRLPRVQVDITICPSIDSDGHDRRSLASASQDAISRGLGFTAPEQATP